jgi:murein DD-endopeptidase MepM/ murein hydrolase activator NlpD
MPIQYLKACFICIFLFLGKLSFAQSTEKGKVINAPKIPQNKKNTPTKNNTPEPKTNDEFDFIYEDQPKLRFSTQYDKNNNANKEQIVSPKEIEGIRIEPLRDINQIVNEDTSKLDEGQLMVVEIEENAMFDGADAMVNVASYYSVWDTRDIDPYHIDPKSFNEVIPLKLYNDAEGRKWSPVLDKSAVTSHFGWRSRRWHKGTDLDLVTGDKVYAAFDGIIRIAGVHSGYGRTVIIRHHNGLETLYGHLSSINFDPNTIVRAGDEIARGGNSGRSSGSHLHFETRFEGNQFDPENIYNFNSNPMQIKSNEFVLSPSVYDYLRGGASRPINVVNENPSSLSGSGTFIPDEIESIEDEEEDVPNKVERRAWYTTKPGDNLTDIARRSNTTVAEICRLNKISSSKKLFVGLRLRLN